MLNHVMVWSGDHWEKINADKASNLYGGATVSSHNKIFYCEACGQYVTLTKRTLNRDAYFKHSSRDLEKQCEDRSRTYGQTNNFKKNSHSLPLKLEIINGSIRFMLGFPPIPLEIQDKIGPFKVRVTNPISKDSYTYSSERFDLSKTTYLNVGSVLSENYHIEVLSSSSVLKDRWQLRGTFYEQSYTLFDAETGKKLPHDADVEINHAYYLIVKRASLSTAKDVCCKRLDILSDYYLKLYEICTNKYTESSSRFFINMGYRLTKYPAKLYPVWPVFVEQPYNILYSGKKIGFFVSGNVRLYDVNLTTNVSIPYSEATNNGSLVEISASKNEHLAYIGRNNVLRYTYFMRSSLNYLENDDVDVIVTDDQQHYVSEGTYDKLPHGKKLYIQTPFDGFIKRFKDKKLIYVSLKAEEKKEIQNVALGERFEIYVGNDCLYTISFALPDHNKDDEIYHELIKYHDQMVEFPHKLLSITKYFDDCPKVKGYLQLCLKKRKISLRAVRKLSKVIETGGMYNE